MKEFKYYIAVTYDVCEVEEFCYEMNQYDIDSNKAFYEQAKEFAKLDVASLVGIYGLHNKNEYTEFHEIAEYEFEEYKCKCTEKYKG